jgi:ribonuclease-3
MKPRIMSDRIKDFEARIHYRFKDRELLERALTHASHGDGRSRAASNERLEFLGDRVLGLMASEKLYETFPSLEEGGLAQRLNAVVNKSACARAARRCDLGEGLRLSAAEERLGGREKESIIADACEAVIGALYLDGGLEAARAFFTNFWADEFDKLTRRPKDAKSQLQEWAAQKGYGVPVYETVARKGPDHRPMFEIEVRLDGVAPARGEGGSKQDAQRAAASEMLKREAVDG